LSLSRFMRVLDLGCGPSDDPRIVDSPSNGSALTGVK
jgi:hypothetical protein